MTVTYKQLTETITQLSAKKNPLLIAIDGRGGSGKSTIAKSIKELCKNVTIVPIDDFYVPSVKRVINQNVPIDVNRLENDILKPLKNFQVAKYQRYDGKEDTLAEWHTITPQGIIIIEGWFSFYATLLPYFNYKIWKEEDKEVCLQRGVQRELSDRNFSNKLTKEALLQRWQKYQQLEEIYFAEQKPQMHADIIIHSTDLM